MNRVDMAGNQGKRERTSVGLNYLNVDVDLRVGVQVCEDGGLERLLDDERDLGGASEGSNWSQNEDSRKARFQGFDDVPVSFSILLALSCRESSH